MTYFEYSLEQSKLDLKYNIAFNNIINNNVYQESVSSFFNKLTNVLISYINDLKHLHLLYKERKHITKGIKYIKNLCKYNTIANQTILIRGYNGKLISQMTLEDDIQMIKNIITYSKIKITDPIVSKYLEHHELYKAGWDTFYKIKIKEVPSLYIEVDQKLEASIEEIKSNLKDLTSYFEKIDKRSPSQYNKNIFKKFFKKIMTSIKRDIDNITMNFEAIQYEIGKKFSKLTEHTANKVVKRDISDNLIIKNSSFIKEIKYGDDVYKIYETKYKNVSAMNYAGSLIYVENGFFDLPKGYQLAIIYHEIGHNECKHFKPDRFKPHTINKDVDIPIEDTEKLVAQIQKDLHKFLYRLSFSPFKHDDRYTNGEEFIYLLVEWQADRFASNIVGKRLVRKALTSHFDDTLKSKPMYNDPKKQKMHYKYNMNRMNIRTKNI